MKNILITGKNSYIGNSFVKYMDESYSREYSVSTISLRDDKWKDSSFSDIDVIFHVAGIAHSDNGNISSEKEKLYRTVNTDLTIEVAKKAKLDGVKQFIYMSSAIVYGNSAPIGISKVITEKTEPTPANCYGDSKLQAEIGLKELADDSFKVCILRPPMIYGKNSKGNYPLLSRIADKLSFFPKIENQRSMLYIGNLVIFVRLMIENEECGIFWPQNAEYSNTSNIVKMIGATKEKNIVLVSGCTWALKLMSKFTGLVDKAFGNLTYDQEMSKYKVEYRKYTLEDSIKETEI